VPIFKSKTLITDLSSMSPPDSRRYYFFTTLYILRVSFLVPRRRTNSEIILHSQEGEIFQIDKQKNTALADLDPPQVGKRRLHLSKIYWRLKSPLRANGLFQDSVPARFDSSPPLSRNSSDIIRFYFISIPRINW
jgi:hypothetical protein